MNSKDEKNHNVHHSTTAKHHDADSLGIWDILHILVEKKKLIILFSVVLAVVTIFITFFSYITTPTAKMSSLNFSLMFNGIENGTYPNGSKFVETDIISTPVLKEVYDKNDLKQYYGSFGKFKNSISIQRYNPALEFLTHEYKAKLSSKRLSSAERYETEQEFHRQIANIIAKPNFTLMSNYPKAYKYNIPNVVIGQILNKILTTWLSMAKTYQGVTKYDVSLMSNKVDTKFIKDIDYFNGADFLRLLLNDLKGDLTKLEKLPNVKNIKFRDDNKFYTLKDIQLRVRFIQNYIMNPLFELIKSSNAYKNKKNVEVYIESQISTTGNKVDLLKQENERYEKLLLEHYTSSPEPIMKANAEIQLLNKEVAFYKNYLKSVTAYDGKQVAAPNKIKRINTYLTKLSSAEDALITLTNKFYEHVCKYNLDNKANFYRVDSFSSYVWHKVKAKFILQIALIIWCVIEILFLALVVCLEIHKRHVAAKYKAHHPVQK